MGRHRAAPEIQISFDASLFAAALQQGAGHAWLTPDANLVPAEAEDGLPSAQSMEGTPLADAIREVASSRLSVEETRESCEALLEADEHPEWHSYEMASFDHRREVEAVVARLNAAGWTHLVLDRDGIAGLRLTVRAAADVLGGLSDDLECVAIANRWGFRQQPADERTMARLRALSTRSGGGQAAGHPERAA